MCTLTWFEQPGGYQVFFNRDERRTREPGLDPAVRCRRSTRFLAPLDGDHGGTWIAVNQRGLCLCLLNGFTSHEAPSPEPLDYLTRGLIALALMEADYGADALARLRSLELQRFRAFMLAVFEPGLAPRLARWSGAALQVEEEALADQPLVSSSFYTDEVRASRAAVFRRLARGAAAADPSRLHLEYHRSHEPVRGPLSPCMHREIAHTVSFSRVRVESSGIYLAYVGSAPCHAPLELPELFLARD